MVKEIPQRLYRCPECGYVTEYRWVLARHLYNVHDFYKRDADQTAMLNEYIHNQLFYRQRGPLRRDEDED